MARRRIGIVGAGAFGTSLAICYSKWNDVLLMSGFEEQVRSMKPRRMSEFLPDFRIPDEVCIDTMVNALSTELDYVLWCLPTQPSVRVLNEMKHLINGRSVVICSKGFAQDGTFLMDAFEKLLPDSKIACLSGPNFATEIAECTQSAADIAMHNCEDSMEFASALSTEYFRLVPGGDVIGVQLCGAAKNVIAIACGIANGLGLGMNAHSALLSISMREISELGSRIGAKRDTFLGLCGVGDIVLTASNSGSRNMSLGKKVANGSDAGSVVKSAMAVCEGYDSTRHLVKLARENGVTLPVCEAVCKVLFDGESSSLILDILRDPGHSA
jgi:glycerol-3-phosphate dehydrogenase (NAD(P)+)